MYQKKTRTVKALVNTSDNIVDMTKPFYKGRHAEEFVQKSLNLSKYHGDLFVYKGINRQPDLFDDANNILYEVKNVKYQVYTQQLKDYQAIAEARGGKFILYVRGGTNPTKLSKELLESGIPIRYFDLE